jgi:hypothetical protein
MLITADLETFYSQQVSLSRTIMEY